MTGQPKKTLLRPLTMNQAKKDRDKHARDVISTALNSLTNPEIQVIAESPKQDFFHQKAREILHIRQKAALEDFIRQQHEKRLQERAG